MSLCCEILVSFRDRSSDVTTQGCRETLLSAVRTDGQEVAQRDERVLTLYRVGGLASCDVWDAGSILEQ